MFAIVWLFYISIYIHIYYCAHKWEVELLIDKKLGEVVGIWKKIDEISLNILITVQHMLRRLMLKKLQELSRVFHLQRW